MQTSSPVASARSAEDARARATTQKAWVAKMAKAPMVVETIELGPLGAHTCIDSTVRHAAELGYEVTLVKDAVASLSWEPVKALVEISAPRRPASHRCG